MRRVLAAIVAMSMVVAGFAVWGVRTGRFDNDPVISGLDASDDSTATNSGVGGRLTVACIPEAEPACAAIETIPDVGFSIEAPELTEGQLGNRVDAAPDGWITTSLSAERVRLVNSGLRAPIDVASTKTVVVTRAGDTSAAAQCKGNLSCLTTAPKVSFPSVATVGIGLSAATSAALAALPAGSEIPASIDDLDPSGTIVSGLRKATKAASTDPLTGLTSVRLLDAVVTSESRIRAVNPPNTTVTDTGATVSIVLLLDAAIDDGRAKRISDVVTAALADHGFDPPVSPRRTPDPGIANQLGSLLR